jgi:hypothetical protein
MLAKIRQLPPARRDELNEVIDDMLSQEHDRKLIREAFEMSARSLDRAWGVNDAERTEKGI